jgi:transcription initiation factor TFIID/TFIIF subunit
MLIRIYSTGIKQAPFRIQEQGWGEFDMSIVLTPFSQPKGEQTVFHDLNFQQERYESLQQFVRQLWVIQTSRY